MRRSMDVIKIEDLEVFAHHGVYEYENRDGQFFYINAWLYTDTRAAGRRDELELSTNYGEVCHFMHTFMKEHTFRLIESVAEQMAEAVLLHFPLLQRLKLEIRKPSAPIGLPFSSVSVQIERGWHEALLAVGSNLGDRETYIETALSALREHPLTQVLAVSDKITTTPYGGVEQEDFLNGAVLLRTLLSPQELLHLMQEEEQKANRVRTVHWGPRTLDLDLILYDDLVMDTQELVIPHPDMQNREFVLKPAAQIAPYYRHPLLHKTIAQLLEELEHRG